MFGIFNVGPMEIILILVVVLIIFGPGKLPQVGKSLGKAIREFRGSVKEVEDVVKLEDDKDEDKKEEKS